MESAIRDEYFDFIRYESVGADPSHFRDTVSCAAWLRKWFGRCGLTAELLYPEGDGTITPPVVFAERSGPVGAPTVLIYGHYDVQPADPVEEWKTPPFEPTEVDGRVFARGSQDDKGQLFALLCGLRDFLSSTPVPGLGVKIIVDGQEESGSSALAKLLEPGVVAKGTSEELRKRIGADVLLVCDTNAAAGLRPAIVAGLRGVSHFTMRLTASSRDLHSGEYGGVAPNPVQGLAELLATLHNPDGSIAVAGFRDGIEPPSHEELRLAEAGTASDAEYASDIGCEPAGGQLGKTLSQRLSFEPTIEINGFHGGYGGPGAKTVIASEAVAKLSMRLVPGQSPRNAFDAVRRHLEANEPRGMKLTIEDWNPGAGGFRLPLSSPIFRLAEGVLTEMDGRGPVFQWDGASIPIVSAVRMASGAAPLIVGWGQPDDRIHSPNESYSIEQFGKARDWGRRILCAISR